MSGHDRLNDGFELRVTQRHFSRKGDEFNLISGAHRLREARPEHADAVEPRKDDQGKHRFHEAFNYGFGTASAAGDSASNASIFATSCLSSGFTLLGKSATTLPLRSIRYL